MGTGDPWGMNLIFSSVFLLNDLVYLLGDFRRVFLLTLFWNDLMYLLGASVMGVLNMLSWEFDRYDIVEGEHPLWEEVSIPYRETIRAFLVYFQQQVYN